MISLILPILFQIVLTLPDQPQIDLTGHWLQVPYQRRESILCPDELRFTASGEFAILNECDSETGPIQTASGSYDLDGKHLVLRNVIFTSRTRPFFTREYGRIELTTSNDTLQIKIYRGEINIEHYIRIN